MAIDNQFIQTKLTEKFGDMVSNFDESYGMLSFEAPKEQNLKVFMPHICLSQKKRKPLPSIEESEIIQAT